MPIASKSQPASAHTASLFKCRCSNLCRSRLFAGWLTLWLLAIGGSARGEFVTVIDSPPFEFEESGTIESNTQVNLYPGGVLPTRYNIGPTREPGDNIEINLLGGSIGEEHPRYPGLSTSSRWVRTTNVTVNLVEGDVWGYLTGRAGALVTLRDATVHGDLSLEDGSMAVVSGGLVTGELVAKDGSTVHMSGGTITQSPSFFLEGATVHSGSVFLMTGGVVNGDLAVSDSFASITGGRIAGRIAVSGGGEAEITGGSLGPLHVYGGTATLVGGEFHLDGAPITGLTASAQTTAIPKDSLLTGVLSDGTPVIVANRGILQDSLWEDQLDLRLAPVPASEPTAFDSDVDSVPTGLRTGQSLALRAGAQAPPNFTALPGSTLSIVGGETGHGLEAAGASITMTAGRIGELSTIYQGTTLRMSGGVIESNFEVSEGARLEVSGGAVGSAFVAHSNSKVVYSGGKFTGSLGTEADSSFAISGGDFRINGAPLTALTAPGSQQPIDLPEGGVLSGVLTDGTPFAFGASSGWFAPGTLSLNATDIPDAGAAVLHVPSDPAPSGLRSGQTLVLGDGGDLGDYFTADWGSVVRVSGGRIGQGFKTVGGLVNITGGEIDSLSALYGSVVNLDGGTINYHVNVDRGAIFNVFSGENQGGLYVLEGGRVNMTGGVLGGYITVFASGSLNIEGGVINRDISLYEGGSLKLLGGETRGGISLWAGSDASIAGGRLADEFRVSDGISAVLSGTDFR
ncbi:MAG: hypothetical protein KDA37_15140, partial [Planctomycetales bacterium]|nr:hypothetical protein [Planctomycetales bacterium]